MFEVINQYTHRHRERGDLVYLNAEFHQKIHLVYMKAVREYIHRKFKYNT